MATSNARASRAAGKRGRPRKVTGAAARVAAEQWFVTLETTPPCINAPSNGSCCATHYLLRKRANAIAYNVEGGPHGWRALNELVANMRPAERDPARLLSAWIEPWALLGIDNAVRELEALLDSIPPARRTAEIGRLMKDHRASVPRVHALMLAGKKVPDACERSHYERALDLAWEAWERTHPGCEKTEAAARDFAKRFRAELTKGHAKKVHRRPRASVTARRVLHAAVGSRAPDNTTWKTLERARARAGSKVK